MVRSMYAGVAGMRAHQNRMDVIGNNIANVNTYGFKSSRVTFRDVYYQSVKGASAPTGGKGGVNPSNIGYGSALGSVDVLQTQSSLATTGNPFDVGISGEGFFQVKDSAGNIFYTRAGMLDIDSEGNLTDVNGNLVLGTDGSPIGKEPGSDAINFNSKIPVVPPTQASGEKEINGVIYTITAGTETTEGNVNFNISSKSDMPIGVKAEAVVSNGTISIYLNSKETFANMGELNTAINNAIEEANGGPHPAGNFTITSNAGDFTNLTGSQITGTAGGVDKGTITVSNYMKDNGFSIKSVGNGFSGAGATTYSIADSFDTTTGVHTYTITAAIGGKTYTGTVTSEQMTTAGSVQMTTAGGAADDNFILNFPSQGTMLNLADQVGGAAPDGTAQLTFNTFNAGTGGGTGTNAGTADATASTPSSNLGLNSFKLQNGTQGGEQTVNDLSSISIGTDGVITAQHGYWGKIEIGRIDLVTFANPKGLVQEGDNYFSYSSNSGDPKPTAPDTNGAGMLAQSSLEMSNVDLSQEFSDMITTQRGYQANSRLITVSDTMLEELINLKR